VLGFGFLHLGSVTLRWKEEFDSKQAVRSVFSTYISEGVMNQLLDSPENIDLGGDSKSVAIVFTDIRGFTPISESMTEQELVAQLNEYFGEMVDRINRHRGTLHKFIGDAIMAVWGDVTELTPQEAVEEATRAGLEMQAALRELNEGWTATGKLPWHMGVGINFGTVMVGSIGAAQRREFTVIGDAVNASSRLEGLTKPYGVDLCVGETVEALLGDDFITRPVGLIVLKGKTATIKVYEVMADRTMPREGVVMEELQAWATDYQKAFDLYIERKFDAAKSLFSQCLERREGDNCSQVYLAECEKFIQSPPDENWNGVTVMETK
jgi:adenylate cyclase